MAARKTQVPGATEAPKEEINIPPAEPNQPEQTADETLQHILNGEDQTTGATEPDTELLQAILQGQTRIENKLDQLLAAGGIDAPKKKRWVQGKHGFELKEA